VEHGVGASEATDLAMRNRRLGGVHIQSCYMQFDLKLFENLKI
jgi:hypothetical protein